MAGFSDLKAVVAKDSFDVRSQKNGAVFYSDDYGDDNKSKNRTRAQQFAQDQTAVGKPTSTVEQTPGGRWLDEQKLFNPDSPVSKAEAVEVWDDCSKKYAEQATGSVRCFVTGSKPESTFRRVELEGLVNNPNVNDINGIPRENLAKVFAKNPTIAFDLVESADVALRSNISTAPIAATAAAAAAPSASMPAGGGPPASRIADMHVCPMVTGIVPHVGGPILTGMPTVLTGAMPQARVTDLAVCAGGPDTIVKASMTVLVGGMPAARIGDMTLHGGVIVTGFPTVLIGS
jgi:uncharacterized Zn-binding protein involved in type VI secretion